MKKVYQVIRLLKLQIISSISNYASVKTSGFPIFVALILFLVMPLLIPQENRIVPTILFESTTDSFRVRLPQGWVIQDVNNTGSALSQEITQGYGILAQLCPGEGEEGQQQREEGEAPTNVTTSTGSCQQEQQSQQTIIHIIRYPNLGANLGITLADINESIPDSVLGYQLGMLQDVGYRDINIINSTDTRILVYNPSTSGILASAPAKLVILTYSTDSAPSNMRIGFLILTATNATPPNLQTITGYSIFYAGASGATTGRAEETIQSLSLPRMTTGAVEILNSFGLIPSEETLQFITDERARQVVVDNQAEDAGEEASQPTITTQDILVGSVMLTVYSLLVIGVVWKFVNYIRENHQPSAKIE